MNGLYLITVDGKECEVCADWVAHTDFIEITEVRTQDNKVLLVDGDQEQEIRNQIEAELSWNLNSEYC